MKHIYAILLFVTVFSCSAKGKVTFDLDEAGLIAVTDDYRLHTKLFRTVFEVMQRARLAEGKDARSALFKLIADKYLADEYRRRNAKVTPEIAAEIEHIYFQSFEYYLNDPQLDGKFKKFIGKLTIPTVDLQKELYDQNAPAAYTNIPLRREKAAAVILAEYGAGQKLTYAQLFDSLPERARLNLFTSPHRESVEKLTQIRLRKLFLDSLVNSADATRKAEYEGLKALVENIILSRNLRYNLGLPNANTHVENNALKERAEKISAGKIRDFYEKNKEKYKEPSTVDCRHLRVKDYTLAVNLRDKIEAGANMADLIKKHSIAADKNDADPGMIRGIKNDAQLHTKPRLHTMCFLPKNNEVDFVKDGEEYEVIKAENRQEGYKPLDDTTNLKKEIAMEIAAVAIGQEFQELKEKLMRPVNIRINAKELGGIK